MALYPYQEQVKKLLLSGKSIILQAPTGAGKTRAALAPFIEAFFDLAPHAFPRKCIYSVPMKVLANQFNAEYTELAASYDRRFREKLVVTIQTGDRPEDKQFEGDLIFTTIDQTLSGFLNIPYGLGNRLANLNAGAIMSSYLVFDELHLFDPDTTLPTTLEMLKMLKGIAPFIIMTATFSSDMLHQLATLLDAVVVPDPANPHERIEMEKIGSQVGKDRRFYAQPGQLTADAVLATKFQRAICICNTVQSAQRLYDELADALKGAGDIDTKVKLLHSRFYQKDRQAKEDWIRDNFDTPQREYTGKRLIQIATQVIEVGVDATSDVLHTELAPASSLLQRAGRCARRKNERGIVHIYLPRDEEGNPYYAPYGFGERGKQLCEATWTAVNSTKFTDAHMSFSMEQALIDAVHTPVDQAIMRELAQVSYNRREDMLRTMRDQERGLISKLIRDVDNRFVFIHPNPHQDERLLTNPWAYDGFSLYPGMIFKAYQALLPEVDSETAWMMKGAFSVKDEEAPARQQTQYKWHNIEAKDAFTTPVIAIHPDLAQYDTERGFRLALSTGRQHSPLRPKKVGWERYSYRRETYAEHVAGLYSAYKNGRSGHKPLQNEIAFVVRRLENELPHFQLAPGQLDQVLRAMFACHDLGKLDVKWQKWAHTWQKEAVKFYGTDAELSANYMAAHTDYDPGDEAQKEAQQGIKPKRPNHAGESGMAAAELFDSLCGTSDALWKAAVTAVFRHHTASANSYGNYRLHQYALPAIQAGLEVVGCSSSWCEQVHLTMNAGEPLADVLVDFDNRHLDEVLLYFLLVRVLRLADQRSQSN